MGADFIFADEAGSDVLVGSEESRLPSILYNEKVYVMSKVFIEKAIKDPAQGFKEIIASLYLFSRGPRLLRRVVMDTRMLLPESSSTEALKGSMAERDQESTVPTKLSDGALVLPRRNIGVKKLVSRQEYSRKLATLLEGGLMLWKRIGGDDIRMVMSS